jgi:AcrR family transcriptional regulator
MSSYKISEKVKKTLIQAAGELFAADGANAVSVKQIAERAGTVPNAITYHFESKDGLLTAVWKYVLAKWDAERLRKYYDENRGLLATHDGKCQLISDITDLLFEMLYAEDQPQWINVFLLRSSLTGSSKKYIDKAIFQPITPLLMEIFAKISGNNDPDSARCWTLNIMGAAAIFTSNPDNFLNERSDYKSTYSFYRRLQYMATRNALFGAGLFDKG